MMLQIQAAAGGHHFCSADWTWKVAGHPDYDLWLVVAGRGFLITEEKEYSLRRGDCFLIPPDFPLFAGHDPHQPLEVFSCHFLFGSAPPPPEDLPLYACMREPTFQESLFRRLLGDTQRGRLDSANLWLTAAVEEHQAAARLQAGVPAGRSWHFSVIENLSHAILASPEHPWQVRRLAAKAHLSPDHFSRLFSRQQGISPQEFIVSARLEYAKNLLLGSSHAIGRVAELAGYESLYYFSRHFKGRMGLSPSRYRRQWLSGAGRGGCLGG